MNDRFVRQLLRAVDDVNHLDPQPDFVLYGGDLAQLGQAGELELGRADPEERQGAGAHDGRRARLVLRPGREVAQLFGEPTYSFDHKGVHFVVLNSVIEKDFWTARGMTPMQRMQTVAGLDNGIQSRFEVGDDAARLAAEGPRQAARRTRR